jgi:hypothetical protein
MVSVVVSGLMMAGDVTPEQAEQVAQQFLNSHRLAVKSQPAARLNMVQHRKTSRRAGAPTAYYVFNVEQDKGFVVVSGDDRTVPILGYGETGSFDVDNMPENMKAWLQGYVDQIEWLNAHPETPVVKKAMRRAQQVVKPLIQTHWGQNDPYNLFCPMDGENRSVTGCVATAMAQLMYYHQYPAQTTKAIPAYTTERKAMKIDEIGVTTIPWNDMQKSYSGKESDTQREAVALLMQLCGASVEMDYASDVSTARSAILPDVLKAYFDYDAGTTVAYRDNYRATDWEDMVYEELAKKRPVYYFGSSIGGGHAFIVDGYDGDGLYHVNWGWNGSSDDYFVLSILDPYNNSGIGASSTPGGYSLDQGAIIGVQRNTGVAYQKPIAMTTESIYAANTTITPANNKFSFSFEASFYNYTGETNTFDWGVGIYNEQGESCGIIPLATNITLNQYYGYSDCNISLNTPSTNYGTYKFMIISRKSGTTEWLKNVDSDTYCLLATIKNNVMTLKNPSFAINTSMSVSGNLEVGGNVQTSTQITNNGTYFNKQFYLRVNGEEISGLYLDLDGEESGSLDISFSPTTAGTKTIELGYKTYQYNETTNKTEKVFHVVATKTIEIVAAKSYSLAFSGGSVTNASGMNINDHQASLRFTVKNTGSNTYNDNIMVYSLKKLDDGSDYFTVQANKPVALTLAAGQSTVVDCDMPLTIDGTYWFIVVFKSEGKFIDLGDSRRYGVLKDYHVEIPAEEPAGIQTLSNASMPAKQRIYTVGGMQLTPQQFEHAPKGVYIVNGRLVTK